MLSDTKNGGGVHNRNTGRASQTVEMDWRCIEERFVCHRKASFELELTRTRHKRKTEK
jgi:hypothetical protein